jgi:hypothetical protein
MKTDWFLLLIPFFVGLLIGGLPCLIAVDPLQKGKPFQKVLEDVPAKTLNIYREVLDDQLRLLHIAQAQPTSSPAPTSTPDYPFSNSTFPQLVKSDTAELEKGPLPTSMFSTEEFTDE